MGSVWIKETTIQRLEFFFLSRLSPHDGSDHDVVSTPLHEKRVCEGPNYSTCLQRANTVLLSVHFS